MAIERPAPSLAGWTPDKIGNIPLDITSAIIRSSPKVEAEMLSLMLDIRRLRNLFNRIPESFDSEQLRIVQQRVKVVIIAELFRAFGYAVPNVGTAAELVSELSPFYGGRLEAQDTSRSGQSGNDFIDSTTSGVTGNQTKLVKMLVNEPETWAAQRELILQKHFMVIAFLSRGVAAGLFYLLGRLVQLVKESHITEDSLGEYVDELLYFGATYIDAERGPVGRTANIVYNRLYDWMLSGTDFTFTVTLADDVVFLGTTFQGFLLDLIQEMRRRGAEQLEIDWLMQRIVIAIPTETIVFRMTESRYVWDVYEFGSWKGQFEVPRKQQQ